jgi:pimeloyl-ACP methyl ester carboxylesterase
LPFCNVNNLNLYFEKSGSGPVIVLLHGLGSSTEDWEYQIPEFSKKFTVISLDFRGFGKSDRSAASYSIPELSGDLAKFLEVQGITKAFLVGISMGGMVALECAATHPERIAGVVATNSLPELKFENLYVRFKFWQRIFIVKTFGLKYFGGVCAKALFPKPQHEELRRKFSSRMIRNDTKIYLSMLESFVEWSIIPKLHQIKCPTLIIGSDSDYTTQEYKESYASKIPLGRTVLIKDSGHGTPFDQPQIFNEAVERFVDEISAGLPVS